MTPEQMNPARSSSTIPKVILTFSFLPNPDPSFCELTHPYLPPPPSIPNPTQLFYYPLLPHPTKQNSLPSLEEMAYIKVVHRVTADQSLQAHLISAMVCLGASFRWNLQTGILNVSLPRRKYFIQKNKKNRGIHWSVTPGRDKFSKYLPSRTQCRKLQETL